MTTPPSVQRVKKTIPDDMEFEILLRLPPKSLDRFRCISKSWNNHILDPWFRKKYNIRSKNRVNIVFHKGPANLNMGGNQMVCEEFGSFNIKTQTIGNTLTTCGVKVSHLKMVTPQGLICFLGYKNNDYIVFMYSLTSHLFLELPKSSQSGFYSGPIVGFGIGYVPSTKKFKIVLWFVRNIRPHQPFPTYKFQVIEINYNNTLMGDENNGTRFSRWRLIDTTHINDRVNDFVSPVNVESTLHWKTTNNNYIISFDLETERFRKIWFPISHYHDRSVSRLHLVNLQGKLGLLKLMDPSNQDACLWRLLPHRDDDDILINWEKIYTFSLGGCFAFESLRPLFFHGEEIVLHSRDYLMFYNLEKGSFEIVRITRDEPVNCSVVGMFYETLSNE